ncbi:hypothetical protein AMTRI_Chr13g92990 [Amborella trichopoda]
MLTFLKKKLFLPIRTSTTTTQNFVTAASFMLSFPILPPLTHWRLKLSPKRLINMINQQENVDLALQFFDHAAKYHPNFFHNPDTYHMIIEKLAMARDLNSMEIILKELKDSRISVK